jgi:hypothetical protein
MDQRPPHTDGSHRCGKLPAPLRSRRPISKAGSDPTHASRRRRRRTSRANPKRGCHARCRWPRPRHAACIGSNNHAGGQAPRDPPAPRRGRGPRRSTPVRRHARHGQPARRRSDLVRRAPGRGTRPAGLTAHGLNTSQRRRRAHPCAAPRPAGGRCALGIRPGSVGARRRRPGLASGRRTPRRTASGVSVGGAARSDGPRALRHPGLRPGPHGGLRPLNPRQGGRPGPATGGSAASTPLRAASAAGLNRPEVDPSDPPAAAA